MKPMNQWTASDVMGFIKGVDKKTWGAIGVGVIGLMFLWVVIINPAWFERPRLRSEMQGMEAQIRQVHVLNQKRPVWEQDQKIFREVIEKTQARLFTSEGIGLLLGQVSKLANESHVEVLASKPQIEATPFVAPYNAKYQANGYDFTVRGGYHELGTFVGRIESYNNLFRIQSLHMVPSNKPQEPPVAELRLLAITATSQASGAGSADVKK